MVLQPKPELNSDAQACIVVQTMLDSPRAAKAMAKTLVKEHLVACGQVIPRITSFYIWEGKLESSREYMVLMKTRSDRYEALEKRIRELHTYEVPDIISWSIAAGDQIYLQWVRESVNS